MDISAQKHDRNKEASRNTEKLSDEVGHKMLSETLRSSGSPFRSDSESANDGVGRGREAAAETLDFHPIPGYDNAGKDSHGQGVGSKPSLETETKKNQ